MGLTKITSITEITRLTRLTGLTKITELSKHMWSFLSDRIIYQDSSPINHIPFLTPDYSIFPGEIRRVSEHAGRYIGYDDWVSHFSREEEIQMLQKALDDVRENPTERIHIVGISTFEGVELIREYYALCGYEDELAKNYTLPPDVRITVSVSLGQLLWCEKDKGFLNTRDTSGVQYGKQCPPVRSPADLRVLQQALRMGIIMGIELSENEQEFLFQLFEKQICSLFILSQMLYFRWERYGFSGEKKSLSFEVPQFLERELEL